MRLGAYGTFRVPMCARTFSIDFVDVECGQFRPYVYENFEKFKMISTPTGSWRSNPSARRGHYLEFFKISMSMGTELS